MEPMSLLIYVASVALAVLTVMVSIMLYELIIMLRRMNRVFAYLDHIRELLEMWEELPKRIFWEVLSRIFEK